MPDTMQGNSNRNAKYYDLPEVPTRGTLRNDGITVPGNSQPNKPGDEYRVGPGQTSNDPHSFAAAGGFTATL